MIAILPAEEGKGRAGVAAWEEEEYKVKMETAGSGLGAFENGDGPDHRWVSFVDKQVSCQTLCCLSLSHLGHQQ